MLLGYLSTSVDNSGAEFKVPTELGKEVSVRVWIVPMHVSGESVDWIHLRAQIHDASGHTITARDIDITKKPSFAKPSKLHRSGMLLLLFLVNVALLSRISISLIRLQVQSRTAPHHGGR
jgi:hypothetical protein